MSIKKEKQTDFDVELISTHCKGCGLCIEVCGEGKIQISSSPNERGIHPACIIAHVKCSGCMKCTAICPDAAIEIYRLHPAGVEE